MTYFELFILIFIAFLYVIFVTLLIISIANSIFYKVPQVWTFSSDFKVMRDKLWKYNLKWKSLVDLWSWTWKVLRFFEKEFSMKATWYEIDFSNALISRILNKIFWYNGNVIVGNYLKKDLSSYDVIYVYWFTVLMPWIEKKVWGNCKEWTLVFTNAFKMPNKKPIEILLDKKWKKEVYIYEI